MTIPPMNLASDPSKKISMREASVADAMDFADVAESHEEEVTTLFLNRVQLPSGHFIDAAAWTAEDRRLGLYWYWLHTVKDTSILLEYDECDHCGKSHKWGLDMRVLADSYRSMEGPAERSFKFKQQDIKVRPHSGKDMEELELLRLAGSVSTLLRIERFSRHVSLDVPDVKKWLLSLSLSEFEELSGKVATLLDEMRHGLETSTDEAGKVYLLSPPHQCPSAGKKEAGTRLRIPFRNRDFVPAL